MKVAPWELAKQPVWWQNIALVAEAAEAGAQKAREKPSGTGPSPKR